MSIRIDRYSCRITIGGKVFETKRNGKSRAQILREVFAALAERSYRTVAERK